MTRLCCHAGMDFFPPLVAVFSKELCTPANRWGCCCLSPWPAAEAWQTPPTRRMWPCSTPCRHGRHLRLLHMALPALVAGAVEAGLVAKEALSRRRRGGTPAGFTDDGFPLGVAFLLKVCDMVQNLLPISRGLVHQHHLPVLAVCAGNSLANCAHANTPA